MAQGVQINFGGDASDAQRAVQAFERTLAAMTKTAEQQAAALGKVNTKLDELGAKKEPAERVSHFGEALQGVGSHLVSLGFAFDAYKQSLEVTERVAERAASAQEKLNAAIQRGARLGSPQAARELGERIVTETSGRIPIDEAVDIGTRGRIEGLTQKEIVAAALAQSRLGIPAQQIIDIRAKLGESFAGLNVPGLLGGVQSAAKEIGADPAEILANLETLGPAGARAGLGLDQVLALVTRAGELTGKKQAVAGARGFLETLAAGVEVKRPATAADINARLAAGLKPETTVTDRVGGAALLGRPDLLAEAAREPGFALGLRAFQESAGALGGIQQGFSSGVVLPPDVDPGLAAASAKRAAADRLAEELGKLKLRERATREEFEARRATGSAAAQIFGFLADPRLPIVGGPTDLLPLGLRQRYFESANSVLRGDGAPGVFRTDPELLRINREIRDAIQTQSTQLSPELSSPDGPANYNGRAAFQ